MKRILFKTSSTLQFLIFYLPISMIDESSCQMCIIRKIDVIFVKSYTYYLSKWAISYQTAQGCILQKGLQWMFIFSGERLPSNRLWSGYIISCVGSCNYCKFPKWREDAKPKAYAMIDSLNWMNVNINLTEETIGKKINMYFLNSLFCKRIFLLSIAKQCICNTT